MTEIENRTQKKQAKQPHHFDESKDENNDRDLLSSLTWALILIWAGLVFLANNLGILDQLRAEQIQIGTITINEVRTWSVIFLGVGVIVFFEAIIRTLAPSYHSSGGNFFLAAIFIGIGLSGLIGSQIVWPFILIGLGFAALASAIMQQKD